MNTQRHEELKSTIWEIANRLRGPYRPPQYRLVMLPMVVLRRLDRVLEPAKDAVLKKRDELEAQQMPEAAIDRLLGKTADPQRNHPLVQYEPLHICLVARRCREHRPEPRVVHQRLFPDRSGHLRAFRVR